MNWSKVGKIVARFFGGVKHFFSEGKEMVVAFVIICLILFLFVVLIALVFRLIEVFFRGEKQESKERK